MFGSGIRLSCCHLYFDKFDIAANNSIELIVHLDIIVQTGTCCTLFISASQEDLYPIVEISIFC